MPSLGLPEEVYFFGMSFTSEWDDEKAVENLK
jgi:hypothetical protein